MAARRVFVAGSSVTRFVGSRSAGFSPAVTLEDYIGMAVDDALVDSGTAAADAVDAVYVGNFAGELFSSQGHLGAAAAGAHPAFVGKPCMRLEGACASGGLAIRCAVDALKAGSADVALVVGAEVQTTVSPRVGGDYLARAAHYSRQRDLDDFVFPALFARRIQACAEAGLGTPRDLALLSEKAYANANRNPKAHMYGHEGMTAEHAEAESETNPCFLGNEELRPFLKISDCSQVSDGGAALVLATEDGLAKLRTDAKMAARGERVASAATPTLVPEIAACEVATRSLYEDEDPTRFLATEEAAARAYAASGLSAADIGVAEVHDCFTVAELLMYEALGFAERGGGKDLVRGGDTLRTGAMPVNLGGGLVGMGHPVGATGVKQVAEVARQMQGRGGPYQLSTPPAHGLCANMGGDDKTAVVTVLSASGVLG